MTAATYVLAGTILTALVTVIGLLLKNSRSSPEQRTADAETWSSISGGMTALSAGQTARIKALEDREAARDKLLDDTRRDNVTAREEAAVARREAEAARRDAAAARDEVEWMRTTVTSFVAPLVAWIDSGAAPPPPEIPAALRQLLAEVIDHERPAPERPDPPAP